MSLSTVSRGEKALFEGTLEYIDGKIKEAGIKLDVDFLKSISGEGGDHRIEIMNAINQAKGLSARFDQSARHYQDVGLFVRYVTTVAQLARQQETQELEIR